MKQLGNLSIVCAQCTDVLMQIYGGQMSVHVGEGPERTSLFAAWDDDEVIQRIIHELNFGRYAIKEKRTSNARCGPESVCKSLIIAERSASINCVRSHGLP